jgi:hypothetical protein
MMVMTRFLTMTLAVAFVGTVFGALKKIRRNAKKRSDAARAGSRKRLKLKVAGILAQQRRSDAARLGHKRRLLNLKAAQDAHDARKRRSDAARLGHKGRLLKLIAAQQQQSPQRTVAVNVGCCVRSGKFAVQVQA